MLCFGKSQWTQLKFSNLKPLLLTLSGWQRYLSWQPAECLSLCALESEMYAIVNREVIVTVHKLNKRFFGTQEYNWQNYISQLHKLLTYARKYNFSSRKQTRKPIYNTIVLISRRWFPLSRLILRPDYQTKAGKGPHRYFCIDLFFNPLGFRGPPVFIHIFYL